MVENYRKLDKEEQIAINDIVISDHPLGGKRKYIITRLTAKFAFAKVRDDYEVKFPSQFDSGFQSLPRQKFNQTDYKIYRQIDKADVEKRKNDNPK